MVFPSQDASNHQHVLIFVLNGAKPIIEIPQLAFATHFGHISRVNKNVLTSPGAVKTTPVHWKQHLVSKCLVTPMYKPFRQFGRGTTLLRERVCFKKQLVCFKKQLVHLEHLIFYIQVAASGKFPVERWRLWVSLTCKMLTGLDILLTFRPSPRWWFQTNPISKNMLQHQIGNHHFSPNLTGVKISKNMEKLPPTRPTSHSSPCHSAWSHFVPPRAPTTPRPTASDSSGGFSSRLHGIFTEGTETGAVKSSVVLSQKKPTAKIVLGC